MKRARLEVKELIMKAKVVGIRVLVMNVAVLAGFSLMQGCTTAKTGEVSQDLPAVLPPGPEMASTGVAPVAAPVIPVAQGHKVEKGETLSSIASSYGTSWKKLADYNDISNPNQLKVGQELRIPDSLGSSAPVSHAKHVTPVSSRPIPGAIKQGSSYTVQKGDSLSSIAKRCGLTINELKTANSLKNDTLVAGKKISIPKKGEIKAAAVAKPIPAKAANPAPAKAVAATDASLPAAAPMAGSTPAAATAPAAAPAVAPAAASAAPAAAAPVASAASAPVYEHVLYPGETLDDVARQYGSSQQEIMKLNNITDPASVKPGTKLLVPIPE
jgi:LysM repeat protein